MNTIKGSQHGTDRKTAVIVGVLYIVGTAAGVLSLIFAGSILKDPDYLLKVSANESRIITGALCVLIMGLALAMVPVLMFPIFRKYNEALALGAVVFRGALETAIYIAAAIFWLLLMTVGQEYVKAGVPVSSHFQTLGALLLKSSDQTGSILDIVFSLGALMIYCLFYQSNLIPRWLSVWGLAGAALYLVSGLLNLFNLDFGILEAPLALQEMFLAVWLIVKGFDLHPVIDKVETVQAAMNPV